MRMSFKQLGQVAVMVTWFFCLEGNRSQKKESTMNKNAYAQRLVNDAQVRILITASDEHGRLRHNSDRSSSAAIYRAPKGWRKSDQFFVKDILDDLVVDKRPAWIFTKDKTKVVALIHEWGPELLLDFGADFGVAVASASVIELTRFIWSKWQTQKRKMKKKKTKKNIIRTKEQSVLRVQYQKKGKGKIRSKSFECSGDLTGSQVEKILRNWLKIIREEEGNDNDNK
jgi:hypothetical protein